MMVSLHFSQEAGTTRRVRPPPVGSPSFAELETRQSGAKSDSESRGRQAEKSRVTHQRTAIYRRLLIFRIANGNLTIEASSAARGPAIKRSIVECAPARASIPALMIGLRGCMQCQSGERYRRASARSVWRRSELAGPPPSVSAARTTGRLPVIGIAPRLRARCLPSGRDVPDRRIPLSL
jgi:hypothetical protein